MDVCTYTVERYNPCSYHPGWLPCNDLDLSIIAAITPNTHTAILAHSGPLISAVFVRSILHSRISEEGWKAGDGPMVEGMGGRASADNRLR